MSYSKNTADYELLSRKMESDGYIVIDEFFSSIEADAFREEIMSLYQKEMKEVGSEDEPLFDSQSSNETSTNRLFQVLAISSFCSSNYFLLKHFSCSFLFIILLTQYPCLIYCPHV